jgi:hypothetical protein
MDVTLNIRNINALALAEALRRGGGEGGASEGSGEGETLGVHSPGLKSA